MNSLFFRTISITLVVSFILTSLNVQHIKAQKVDNNYNEKEVQELAAVLELIYDKSAIYDGESEIIGFNKKILENGLKDLPEYNYLIDEFEEGNLLIQTNQSSSEFSTFAYKRNPKWQQANNKCISRELKSAFGPAAATAIINAVKNKAWKKAAKKLLKLGIKSSLPGLMGTLGYISVKCGEEANMKHKPFL